MGFLKELFGGVKGLDNNNQYLLNQLPQQQSLGTANTVGGLGTIDSGVDKLGQAGDFFSTLLNGSTDATSKVLQPEVKTVMDQYDNALKSATELGPRGGGRTNAIEAAKTGKAGAYGNLLGKVQGGAAQGLAGVGSAVADAGKAKATIGLGETGQAIGQTGELAGVQSKTNNNVFNNALLFGKALSGGN